MPEIEVANPVQKPNVHDDRQDGSAAASLRALNENPPDRASKSTVTFKDPSKNYQVETTQTPSGLHKNYSYGDQSQNYSTDEQKSADRTETAYHFADRSKDYWKTTYENGSSSTLDMQGKFTYEGSDGTGYTRTNFQGGTRVVNHGPDERNNYTLDESADGTRTLTTRDGRVLTGSDIPKFFGQGTALFSPSKMYQSVSGQECELGPKPGQVPVVSDASDNDHCTYAGSNRAKDYLDIPDIYNQVAPSVAKLETYLDSGRPATFGSGVMIGKGKDECFVLTDDHVAKGDEAGANRWATTSDGSDVKVRHLFSDKEGDLAVVALETGDKTNEICKPIKFADSLPAPNESVGSMGLPVDSHTLVIAPGTVIGETTVPKNGFTDGHGNWGFGPAPGTKLERVESHVLPGMSGGPAVSKEGVWGLNEAGSVGNYGLSQITPLTQSKIDEILAKVLNPRK